MKIRILVQVGAYHKNKENPNADFMFLSQPTKNIIEWVGKQAATKPKVTVHQLADGTPHLVEMEYIVYKEIS